MTRPTPIALAMTATLLLAAGAHAKTKPATGPATQPSTQPATQHATQPGTQAATKRSPQAVLADSIARAHGRAAYRRHAALRMRMNVMFKGNQVLDGRVSYNTQVDKARFDLPDATVVFDGSHAWVAPDTEAFPNARFHILTWPYFHAMMMKLDDPGAHLGTVKMRPLDGKPHKTTKLTFSEGVGDAPDDWYIVYQDPETGLMAGAAYIVTYGQDGEPEEPTIKMVRFHDYETVDGVTLPTYWKFYHWQAGKGPHGEAVGEVKVSEIEFFTPDDETFTKPDGAEQDPLPGA